MVRLIQLVLVLLVEVFILIVHPRINRVQKFVCVLFKLIFQGHRLLSVVPIESHFGLFLSWAVHLILSLRELNVHFTAHPRCNIVHWVWMIKVRPVNDILNISLVLVPHMLLLHDFLEWVSEVLLICLILNNFVQSWIQSQNWVFFLVTEIFQESFCSEIIPMLRVLLQKPSIVVFKIQLWIAYKVWHFDNRILHWSRIFSIQASVYVVCEKLFDLACLRNTHTNFDVFSLWLFFTLTKIKKRALVRSCRFESVVRSNLGIIRDILAIENVVVVLVDFI